MTTCEQTVGEKGLGADLERRVGLALAEEVSSRDGAGIDVLRKVEVDDSETWVSGCIWVAGDHTLCRRVDQHVGWREKREGYLHDDELG